MHESGNVRLPVKSKFLPDSRKFTRQKGLPRSLLEFPLKDPVDGHSHAASLLVLPDYLAVGSNEDYFLTPMSPLLAQRIADATGCILPTKKIVDAVYAAAEVKLPPQPIAPSAAMITVPVFVAHNDSVWRLPTRRGRSFFPRPRRPTDSSSATPRLILIH